MTEIKKKNSIKVENSGGCKKFCIFQECKCTSSLHQREKSSEVINNVNDDQGEKKDEIVNTNNNLSNAAHVGMSDDETQFNMDKRVQDEFGNNLKWICENGKGTLNFEIPKPIIAVPIYQEIFRKQKVIEIPKVEVIDEIVPKIYHQRVDHEVPNIQINFRSSSESNQIDNEESDDPESHGKSKSDNDRANILEFLSSKIGCCTKKNITEKKKRICDIVLPKLKLVSVEKDKPVVVGYRNKYINKWKVKEVPRCIIKYVGSQEEICVEVPKIEYREKVVEKEYVVGKQTKKVIKPVEVPEYYDVVKYVWKPVYKNIPIDVIVPKFDVDLYCPNPLLVPYTVIRRVKAPPVFLTSSIIPDISKFDGQSMVAAECCK